MDDVKEVTETSNRGNEWEVVSLTASAYAAAPGPRGIESNDEDKGSETKKNEDETSHAMFMSGHFVFPPSQHENLPLEPDESEIHNEQGAEDVVPEEEPELDVEVRDLSDKNKEEIWNVEGVTLPDEFAEGKNLQGLDLVGEELRVYDAAKFCSFHNETKIGGSVVGDEMAVDPESSQFTVDSPSDSSPDSSVSVSPRKDNIRNRYGLPCEAWWKRQAAALYAQAKEANAIWSVFVAAALMGIVILGQRWQQERWQAQQLKWQFSVSDEKVNWMMGPISRFKDAIAGGPRRSPVIRGSATSTNR
ncbi:hypothetical protein GIB67_037282 [Kingdonia uniflora]|uniref:Uncharacterized protein n=1 Tax=Kingdonia uniflora TaxID=39325 RepID=A0A7J7MRY9_9MAGN|nr:hypothetical protein GIB67_037282 [Kingdonia uniflora]